MKTCLSLCKKNIYSCGSSVCARLHHKNGSAFSHAGNMVSVLTDHIITLCYTALALKILPLLKAHGLEATHAPNQSLRLALLTRQDTAKKKSATNASHTKESIQTLGRSTHGNLPLFK